MLENVCEKLKFLNLKIQLRDGNQEIVKKAKVLKDFFLNKFVCKNLFKTEKVSKYGKNKYK